MKYVGEIIVHQKLSGLGKLLTSETRRWFDGIGVKFSDACRDGWLASRRLWRSGIVGQAGVNRAHWAVVEVGPESGACAVYWRPWRQGFVRVGASVGWGTIVEWRVYFFFQIGWVIYYFVNCVETTKIKMLSQNVSHVFFWRQYTQHTSTKWRKIDWQQLDFAIWDDEIPSWWLENNLNGV